MENLDKKLYLIIGEMLRDARLKRGMTLEQIADKLNVTPKTIQRYEFGERKIKMDILVNLTSILGLDYSSFLKEAQIKQLGKDFSKEAYFLNKET